MKIKQEQIIFIIQRIQFFKLNYPNFKKEQLKQHIQYLTEINKILFEEDLTTNETKLYKILLDYARQTEQQIKKHLLFI